MVAGGLNGWLVAGLDGWVDGKSAEFMFKKVG